MKKTLLPIVISLLTSCAPPTTAPIARIPFPAEEYEALPKTGTGTVTGQAFLKTRGGDVKTAAGNEVILNPVTSYSLQWWNQAYLANRRMEVSDPRYPTYQRRKIADGQGRFSFKNVPPGEYFVGALVQWEAATGYRGALERQGGYVARRITVRDGEETEVIVTK